jgi:hypothetical protein
MAKYWRVLGPDGYLTLLITEDKERADVFCLVVVRPDAGDVLSIPGADKVQKFIDDSVPTDWARANLFWSGTSCGTSATPLWQLGTRTTDPILRIVQVQFEEPSRTST